MRNKKIGTWIARLLITMLTVLGLGQTMVYAVENTVPADPATHKTDVIITKVKTDADAKTMTPEQLAGGIDNLGEHFGAGSEVLPGVSFTWYKVDTAAKLQEMIDTPGLYDTADKLVGVSGVELKGTTDDTDANGQVTIPNLSGGFYWVVENTKGTIATSTAVPFALNLPFTNAAGNGFLDTIYVYPKNTLQGLPENPEKGVDEKEVAIGQLNTWTISMDIPIGIEDYVIFDFIDEIDSRLDYENNVLVSATGVIFDDTDDYIVTFDNSLGQIGKYGNLLGKPLTGTLTVSFTEDGRAKLADANPKKVEIKFDTKVNKTAIMGQDIYNNVVVDYDNGNGDIGKNQPVTPPFVRTGGKAFVKKDLANQGQVLAGAEFKIRKPAGDFVKVGANGVITFVAEADATIFTSGANGKFEVRGLPYGEYVLVETKAPQGYALPTEPNTNFTVNATSYHSNPTEIVVGQEEDANVVKTIDNRRLVIPQTGGIGTALFTVIGAVMMLFSALFYKRTKEA